jgi:hypothetical protein
MTAYLKSKREKCNESPQRQFSQHGGSINTYYAHVIVSQGRGDVHGHWIHPYAGTQYSAINKHLPSLK